MATAPQSQKAQKKSMRATKPQQTYTVKAGDTLASIATRLETTVAALMASNPDISNPDILVIGQEIVIPESGPAGVQVGRDVVMGDVQRQNKTSDVRQERRRVDEAAQGKGTPPRVTGIDVSEFSGTIDWSRVKAAGQEFVFLKATQGTDRVDSSFLAYWLNAKAAGILRGAYHFFQSGMDPNLQADHFIKTIKSTNDDGELPPVLDIEQTSGTSRRDTLVADVKTWLDIVESAFGKKPIIYSGPIFLQENLLMPDGLLPSWVNEYPLWIAQYPTRYTLTSNPKLPQGWANWSFWQYSDKGRVDGISTAVDLNVFNGSSEDLRRIAAPATVVPSINKIRLNFALNDRPEGPDRLSYEKYADAFSQVLSGQYTQTPLTVGIYATWGMGKSFLLGKIKERLKLLEEQRKELYFAFIDFNAWVYSGSENLWAGLVTSLYNGIEEHYKARGGRLVQSYRRKEALKQIWQTLIKSVGLVIAFGLPALAISILLDWKSIEGNWRSLIDTLLLIFAGSPLLTKLPDLIKGARSFIDSLVLLRSQELADLSSRRDFRDKIGFMADIQSELRHISHLIQEIDRKEKKKTRFVIFVDDLDRCPPNKAVEVLEAIMLLLSDNNKDPFIIFLAMDARVLVKAIEMRYGQVLTESGISGYEFLDKIVQIPFRIPPANDDAIKGYVKSLLYQTSEAATKAEQPAPEPPKIQSVTSPSDGQKVHGGNGSMPPPGGENTGYNESPPDGGKEPEQPVQKVTEEEPFSKDEKDAFEGFSKFISRNPRRVKRIVNIYRLVRILLSTEIPVQVAIKWTILTEQWPFRIAWVMQKIEDERQLGKPLPNGTTLSDVYAAVDCYIKEEKSHQLALLDEDGEEFDAFIAQQPQITVDAINILWAVTFNLNPAMQSEVLKSALLVNGMDAVQQPKTK